MKVEGAATNRIGAVYGGKRRLMASVTVTEDIRRGIKQLRDLEDRFLNGSVDPRACRNQLQDLIQGKFSSAIRSYVSDVDCQLDRWRVFGVNIDAETRERILQQADAFEPLTDDDNPLVSGGFGYNNPKALVTRLWNAFVAPTRYQKIRYIEENTPLRYAFGMKPSGGLRLVHYQHNSYAGFSPEQALVQAKADHVRVASVEVLENLLLGPSAKSWDGQKIFFPNLSGFQAKYDTGWSHVPSLDRFDVSFQLRLDPRGAGFGDSGWSSPVVTEC